ncbi:hypothetical protein PRUPE_1G310200 [Prunus persica]|uniref:Uncharacterized protein n=1 Tax=Prunus persica TaxID=3760 RepID=A0A251R5T3_PRUPE|nr:hypothetical protein PRUPE_1G310200 [Prunus persica]
MTHLLTDCKLERGMLATFSLTVSFFCLTCVILLTLFTLIKCIQFIKIKIHNFLTFFKILKFFFNVNYFKENVCFKKKEREMFIFFLNTKDFFFLYI